MATASCSPGNPFRTDMDRQDEENGDDDSIAITMDEQHHHNHASETPLPTRPTIAESIRGNSSASVSGPSQKTKKSTTIAAQSDDQSHSGSDDDADEDAGGGVRGGAALSALSPAAAKQRAAEQWVADFNWFVSYHKRMSIINAAALIVLACMFRYVGTPLRARIAMHESRVFARPPMPAEEDYLVQNAFPVASLSFVGITCMLIENLVCGWFCVKSVGAMLGTSGRNRIRPVSATCVFMCLFVQAAICNGIADPLEIFLIATGFVLLCVLHSTDRDGTWPVHLNLARLGWFVYSILLLIGTLHTARYAKVAPIAFSCFAALLFCGGLIYMMLWFRRVPDDRIGSIAATGTTTAPSPARAIVDFSRERDMFLLLSVLQPISAALFVLGM